MEDTSKQEENSEAKTPQQESTSQSGKKSNVGMIVVIVVVVLVVLSAGGYFASRYLFKSWFEKQTGISVDEDSDSAKLETDDGEAEVGENLTLPSYWPSDVPVYAEDSISTVGKNGEEDFYLSFTSGSTADEIYNWYIEELETQGWTITSQLSLETGSNISAEKSDRSLSVIILKEEDGGDTTTSVVVGPND
ncbi:MAG: hypothetical protein ABH837_03900 [bacterium]